MKTIIFMGRSGCGKTTLTQALRETPISYQKTQDIQYYNGIIDTPGEYAENHHLGRALALYSYEANADRAERWLRLSGCKKVFHINSKDKKTLVSLLDFLQNKE